MKRPLWLIGFCTLIAIRVVFSFSPKTGLLLSFALALTAVFFLLLKKQSLAPVVIALFALSLGCGLGAYNNMVKILPFQQFVGKELTFVGFVEEANHSQRSSRYTVKASFADTQLPDSRLVVRDYSSAGLTPGESYKITMVFNQPKYENTRSYYLRENIPGEGVLTSAVVTAQSPKDNLARFFIKLRANIYSKNNSIYTPETAAVINGMVFGLTDDLEPSLYHSMNRAGTSHMLSVSGFHFSVFIGVLLWVLGLTALNYRITNIIAMAGVTFFALLVGFSPPVFRSLIMALVFLLGKTISRQNDSLSSLGLAGIIVGIFFPQWSLSVSMWLSFLSTAGIIILGTPITNYLVTRLSKDESKKPSKFVLVISASLGISFAVCIFTLPVLVASFGWVSLVAPLANLLTAPFSTGIIVLGIATALLPAGFPLFPLLTYINEVSTRMLVQISQRLGGLRFSTFSLDHAVLLAAFLVCLVLCVFALAKKPGKEKVYALVLVCALLLSSAKLFAIIQQNSQLQLAQLEDNSTVLINGNSAVIFGTPDTYSVEELIKYLDYREVRNIEALVLTDFPTTPTSALNRLSANYPMGMIIGPDDSYVLDVISQNMAGVPVYSSGYATLTLLDKLTLECPQNGDVLLHTPSGDSFVLSGEKYGIISGIDNNLIPIWEPIGEHIYREQRFQLI